AEEESFYSLLGVEQDADLLTIRKAFKSLALEKHPDKNPDDPNAHSIFVRINRAYEVLKDAELRRKYDQFGEKGLEDGGGGEQHYQSWQFYNDNFGIYDDDPEIITLGRGDFEEEVFQSGEIWFVNFYSAFCSHCHHLAPIWRELAKRVPEGVARIGAVNCAEDPGLCRSQNVMGYPSLIVYPQQEWFQDERTLNNLLDFLLSQLSAPILQPTVELPVQRPFLLELCLRENECISEEDRKKIAAISNQLLMPFAVLDCSESAKEICKTVGAEEGMFLLSGGKDEKPKELYFADLTDLRTQLLSELPELEEFTYSELQQKINLNKLEEEETILLIFLNSKIEEFQKEWKRLLILFPELEVKLIVCEGEIGQHLCNTLNLGKLPKVALFRIEGGYDLNYVELARPNARQSANSSHLWIIDHFAPWCPPCLQMLDELRKLPSELTDGRKLRVGTLDCDAYRDICTGERINSYPRTILYMGDDSKQQQQHSLIGFHTVDQLLEFISEALNPTVQVLNPDNFDDIVYGGGQQSFFVDFFAPWCGPCQKLAPEFRQLARQWASTHNEDPNQLVFASVDCEQYSNLCNRENINSFPSLRFYRKLQGGKIDVNNYPSNWWRNVQTMSHWLTEMMPSLVQKIAGDFANTVLDSSEPWLIDFYAPWCSHCIQFAPTFERLAQVEF
uniref:DnaJ homolog subfamily C member 10 n=1 Tax=Meloidogyne javanica TaxID=6303 RepID=A0A915MIP4_MELJA